jgi:hypothetical protein
MNDHRHQQDALHTVRTHAEHMLCGPAHHRAPPTERPPVDKVERTLSTMLGHHQ